MIFHLMEKQAEMKLKKGRMLISFKCNCYSKYLFTYYTILNVQFQKKIHTHPTEGHCKFLGGGGGS